MNKAQLMAEVKKRLPHHSDKDLEDGILEFAKAHPQIEPEEALQVLDTYLAENGAPKPSQGLTKYLEKD